MVDAASITVDCLTKNVTENNDDNVVAVHGILRHHTEKHQSESPQIDFDKCIELHSEGESPAASTYRVL